MGVTSCISNYNPNGYNNNERCTFIVNRDINVFSTEFNTEGYFDQLVVNGKAYAALCTFLALLIDDKYIFLCCQTRTLICAY